MKNNNNSSRPSAGNGPGSVPYWQKKRLDQMSQAEWEGLCDRCGRCCLMKLEDEETGHIYATDIGCRLLDDRSCQCEDYENRHNIVTDCVKISPQVVSDLTWLPQTCAYRLVDEGRDLYWWHHLISGAYETVHAAGISIKGRIFAEKDVPLVEMENHIVDWPFRDLPASDRTEKLFEVKKTRNT